MEQRFDMAAVETTLPETVQSQLAAIEESLAVLRQRAQQNQDASAAIEGKIQALEQKVAQQKALSAPAPPAPAKKAAVEEKAAPKPPQEKTPAEKSPGTFHVVEKGENLFRISVRYNVALDRLAEINDMNVNDPIYPGQKIKIP
jgi:LysM repeat protein